MVDRVGESVIEWVGEFVGRQHLVELGRLLKELETWFVKSGVMGLVRKLSLVRWLVPGKIVDEVARRV